MNVQPETDVKILKGDLFEIVGGFQNGWYVFSSIIVEIYSKNVLTLDHVSKMTFLVKISRKSTFSCLPNRP